jgi:hypothetical protein
MMPRIAKAALHISSVTLLLALGAIGPSFAQTAPKPADSVSEDEARSIAVDAYLYLYPLVTMDVTRRQISNIESGKGFGGPMNTFANIAAFPTAEDKAVVRPNFDTLYSSSFLDLRAEPVVVSVPDTGGRYYLLPMLDMWSDVFASRAPEQLGRRPVTS